MTTMAAEARSWSPLLRAGVIVLVFMAQVGLIFWFGEWTFPTPRPTTGELDVVLIPELPAEWIALNDPTLFAKANRMGFSGVALAKVPTLNYQLADWTQPPRPLLLPINALGETICRVQPQHPTNAIPAVGKVSPHPTPLETPAVTTTMVGRSTLRIEGELAKRRVLLMPELPSWPHSDLLGPTVVQVMVDNDGRTVSAVILTGSGNRHADQYALESAKRIRFERAGPEQADQTVSTASRITWGRLVFDWHATQMSPTNAPATTK